MTLTTLTRKQVLAMKPGEEMDALISKLVFGVDMVSHVPYSTNDSLAVKVLDQFDKASLRKIDNGRTTNKYVCRIETPKVELSVPASNAPEAIGKAAILAKLNL